MRQRKFKNVHDLVTSHYEAWSEPNHRSQSTMLSTLTLLPRNCLIIETGTSAWGCDSSRLFDSVANYLDGIFISIDIRKEASEWLKWQTFNTTKFLIGDSIKTLEGVFRSNPKLKVDLAFLDSLDLDLNDPTKSENHHFEEFMAIAPYLKPGSFVVIDDTPSTIDYFPISERAQASAHFLNTGRIPGKGSLVLQEIQKFENYKVISHDALLTIAKL